MKHYSTVVKQKVLTVEWLILKKNREIKLLNKKIEKENLRCAEDQWYIRERMAHRGTGQMQLLQAGKQDLRQGTQDWSFVRTPCQ